MVKAGRNHKPAPKLDKKTVAIIRRRIANGAIQKDLAKQYGVSEGLITMIKKGERYN